MSTIGNNKIEWPREPPIYGCLLLRAGCAVWTVGHLVNGQQHDYSPSIPWDYGFSTDNANQTVNLAAIAGASSVSVNLYINGNLELSDSASSGCHALTGTYTISELLD